MHVFDVISFNLVKIEQKCIFVLVRLNSTDLRGNSQRLNFTKTTLQKMSMTAMER